MYQAELHGKLSSKIEHMEDVLTSNVFSFFKYCNRNIFLMGYLTELGIDVTDEDAKNAEFLFWYCFDDNTEPDLIIIIGKYYLLIEAKYFYDFAPETSKLKAQLIREIEAGYTEAENRSKTFKLIAITKDHYKKEDKFKIIPQHLKHHLMWTNWQAVTFFLYRVLETNKSLSKLERAFASDLYDLLLRKKLRNYQGLKALDFKQPLSEQYQTIFFEAKASRFRGDFFGFETTLASLEKIQSISGKIFFGSPNKRFDFSPCMEKEIILNNNSAIFYKKGETT